MSVIIKGMSMPETCYECRFCEEHSEYPFSLFCVAHLNCIEDPRSGRLDTCPLEADYEFEEAAFEQGYESAVKTMTRLLMERKPHYCAERSEDGQT